MKVYVVLHEDRHTDPEVEAFSSAQQAVARARAIACSYPGCEVHQVGSYLFYAQLSEEGDQIRVYEREIQPCD